MLRKVIIISLLVISCLASGAMGADPNSYISAGRTLMFNGTVSGLRQAYEVFDQGINDATCELCATDRELIFLHALTRIIMWAGKDDGDPIDSGVEFARLFDVELVGDQIEFLTVSYLNDVNEFTNEHDYFEIPETMAAKLNSLGDFNNAMIPEIDATLAELDLITDSPGDRFQVFFKPSETGLLADLELDYAEVLILKAGLTIFKAMLQEEKAYDTIIDANNMILQRNYGNCFSLNTDVFDPYPNFLKVLPTANDTDDGKAILAIARQSWIDGINYYLEVIEYIRSEEDPQEDDLLYTNDDGDFFFDRISEKLNLMRDSLQNDTTTTLPIKTVQTYQVYDANSTAIGQLSLAYNVSNIDGDEGSLTFTNGFSPDKWKIEWFGREGNDIEAEFEYYSDYPDYQWLEGYFEGTISRDYNSITNATFEYWGWKYENYNYLYYSGAFCNLSAQLTGSQVAEEINFDLNPLFGSSARYPDPLSPRDLLPVFDEWNDPQPDTMGHGLGDDATLGGIIPDMNQRDWQINFDLQPSGQVVINAGTATIDGSLSEWSASSLVFHDIENDTDEAVTTITGVDVDKFYISCDSEYLYGAITLYDDMNDNIEYRHELRLSYSPKDDGELNSIILPIFTSSGQGHGDLYQVILNDYGYGWNYITALDTATGANVVEFKVPLSDIPGGLGGRYISLGCEGWTDTFPQFDSDEELNGTHLKIAGLGSDQLGSISGNVSFAGYDGEPIFVQAYLNPKDPEESIVASTMITAPGAYRLDGIGLGWQGYVRAFTPLFGFENPLELEAFEIEAAKSVTMPGTNLNGVDITLNMPTVLEKDIWESGQIDANIMEVDWYCFDAVAGGTYTLDIMEGTADYACITLYGRDGDTELIEQYYWQDQQIVWTCTVSGKYYVSVTDEYYPLQGGSYQIRMTSDTNYLPGDLAGPDGVKDGVIDNYDLEVVASHWLDECSGPDWCGNTDLNKSGSVNYADFALLGSQWLQYAIP